MTVRCQESGGDEPVTHSRFVDDQHGPRGVGFELLPQSANRDAQVVDLPFPRGTPHCAEQLRVGQYPAGVLGELGELG